ncbi:hypothetical protein GCM10023114_42070 [Mycolicibacterium sediminis]|uniref:Uncharacterized protein n=1 Tax=Mycolicibacterium sediminis TaxID=1286180 RepID=A0A7I7QUZ4_9MYCO|nr:hypothetical protein MSEDJ_42850 [Mycolicibacterium sediminis]
MPAEVKRTLRCAAARSATGSAKVMVTGWATPTTSLGAGDTDAMGATGTVACPALPRALDVVNSSTAIPDAASTRRTVVDKVILKGRPVFFMVDRRGGAKC